MKQEGNEKLTQPIINSIDNFDAKKDYEMHFYYLGAKRSTRNQISIREAIPLSTPVYEGITSELNSVHMIPANSLTNGKKYWIKVRVTTDDTNWGVWSEEAEFYCLSTPVVRFETIDDHGLVYNDDLMMTAVYSQSEGEMVETYQFTLYDDHKQTITAFPTRFPSVDSPNRFEERVSGLVKGKTYHMGAHIKTVKGLEINYLKPFVPQYQVPTIDGVLRTTNESEHGQVIVEAFMKQVLGTQVKPFVPNSKNDNDDNYTYLNKDWVIIPDSKPLIFTKLGMGAAKDFKIKLWCKNIANGVFIDMSQDGGDGIHLKFVKYDNYITCEKEYGSVRSRVRSNVVDGLGMSEFYLYIEVVAFRVRMLVEKK